MNTPMTVLVLTPSLGGSYFGELLAGLGREVVAAGGRLVVVETLQEFAPRDEAGQQGDFATRAAWADADGVVSITTAVGVEYLERLRDAGKPVVLLSSTQLAGFEAPAARPDNHQGTVSAVEHLIGHGHTRIGFVGNLTQRDIHDRFEAYRQTLEAHGLTADPGLLFEAPQNGESGGAAAAPSVIKALTARKQADRPTALMVATDRNTVGLLGELAAADIQVPRDLAIASFDNIPTSTYTSPTITSADPGFDEVGALAGRLVLARIRGEEVPDETSTPGSAVLLVRESCGCEPDTADAEGRPADALRGRLQEVLLQRLRTGDASLDGATEARVGALADEAVRLLESGDQATTSELQGFIASLRELADTPDALRPFMDAMGGDGTSPVPSRLSAALWKAQAGAFLRQAQSTAAAIAELYVVDAGLLDTGADPRGLDWLTGTGVKAAALALWEDAPSASDLEVVGVYDPDGVLSASMRADFVGSTLSSEEFPPQGLVSVARGREVCVVVPVSTRERDWGLLAVVAEVDPSSAHESYQHWAALLCAALESQRREEEVRRSALFDALTGLPNRQLFVQQLEQALARWKRSATPFSVLFLDLDGFKLINDSLGHQMGDMVLQTVGAKLKQQLRAVDTAARFGGDEFVILLADTDADSALLVIRRVQSELAQVMVFEGHEIVTRASIGVASSAIEYGSAEEVLRDADAAMYRAKAAEPGSVAFFDAPMHEQAVRRAALAREVLRGLHENQFEVHYQPIVNLESGITDRFEALVRWRHPERGLISPQEFLVQIVDTSLIVQLGHWVLNEVCRQLAEWGPRVANVSINISDKEFWSQDLQTYVLTTLGRHGLSPELLTLEITESVLMRRPEMALRIMQKLHDAGLRLHIDDFGTGFSSLETLHRFPVEAFKIDRSFIQTLTSVENSSELISSLVKLGKALGLAVVAEGVETEEQLASLQELGCATGQGYLFMPAVAADEATALLGKSLHAEDGDSRP